MRPATVAEAAPRARRASLPLDRMPEMSQLWIELLLAALVIGATTTAQALFIAVAFEVRPHVVHRVRSLRPWWLAAMFAASALWMLLGTIAGIWLWAGVLLWLDAFDHVEEALYFSIVAYTTVGYGDVIAPPDWRILGATIAANGMLGFGIATAALIDLVLRTQNELRS
jgi:voltage-gated potassium channel Kch